MANIKDFIDMIGIARYGKDVRSSIINALNAVNEESEKSVLLVDQSAEKAIEASNIALEASNKANELTSRAETVILSAEQSALEAENRSIQAGEKAELSEENAKISKSYAVGGTGTRENEDVDNAMYYYQQAKHISQGNNGLVPMGTITFEDLPTTDIMQNAMYNISNAFISDERFLDGGGLNYGAGSNVYYTANGKWDVLAASSVNGVKGNKESEYRQGNVNITPENIGALPEDGNAVSATKATQDSNGNNIVETYRTKTGDTADNVVLFSSGDSVNPTGWEDINVVESGETHGSLFRKISLAIKNLRYLYNMIGTADISEIGDGTIKGAITGLNNGITAENNVQFDFSYDAESDKYGYKDADGNFCPFGNGAELMWTNPAPASSFNAQTIDIGVNPLDYDFIMLKVRRAINDGHTDIYALNLNESSSCFFWATAISNVYRQITVTDVGINFTVCNNASTAYAIPCEIWVV